MYNLNGSMSGVPMLGIDGCSSTPTILIATTSVTNNNNNPNNLTVGSCSNTPLTPEILNSVMAMTNPLEYSFPSMNSTTTKAAITNQQQQISADSDSNGSFSPLETNVTTGGAASEATTPTVQQTCSQLIKTSLKLSLEMKRKASTGDSSGAETAFCKKIKEDFDSSDDEIMYNSPKGRFSSTGINLTPEDEDRRRRRRERNKIAATKCRMKKREKTINLVSEAETLETQNIDLKQEIQNLEITRRTLTEMLQSHAPACMNGPLQMPTFSTSLAKLLQEYGLSAAPGKQSISSDSLGGGGKSSETTTSSKRGSQQKMTSSHKLQKIPSVSTLKFGARRSNRNATQTSTSIDTTTAQLNNSGTISSIATSTACCLPPNEMQISPIQQDIKPLPSIDMGFCEGRNDNLTPTSSYCKSLISSSSDCYALSSPDSGFITSPADIGKYSTMQTIIKNDYIPNCGANDADLSFVDGTNGESSIEFILKSELVDANDSPYTTVQSADRFLFDGCNETFDTDMDATANNQVHYAPHQTMMDHRVNISHGDSLKEHLMMQGMNNNNSSHINNNHNNNLSANHINGNHQLHGNCEVNNSPVITSVLPTHSSSIIEFNNCQQYIDNSLLKGDFSNQNCEFLPFGQDTCDSQFTTDLDSGVTTYTNMNMTNGSGCLA